jgi:hypothetical protein
MKKIFLTVVLLVFSANLFALDSYPDLKSISKLSDLKSEKSLMKNDITATKKVKKFEFSINPYIWAVCVGGTVAIPSITHNGVTYPSNYNYSFNKTASDAISNLKMAAMFDGRFKYERVSFLYDVVYVNLKGFDAALPGNFDSLAGHSTSQVTANTTTKELIIDLAIGYEFPQKNKGFFLNGYLGARLWSVDAEITLNDAFDGKQYMGSKSNSWLDPILGMNAQWIYAKNKWGTVVKGDLGGFGVNSQFTIMMAVIQQYRISPIFDINLGFKWLAVNYNKDASVWNVNNYGALLGFGVRL